MSFNPYPGQDKHLREVPIALTSVAFVFFTARILTTYKNRGWFGAEDVFIVAAFLCLVVFCIILVQASRYGFGKHVVDIQKSGGNLITALKYYYLSQIAYKANITFNKLAFLFLYLRVFALSFFRKLCLVMICIIVASGIAFVLLTIFQCTPIEKVWLKNAVDGHCVSLPWFRWTWAAFNLFTDLFIFMMPMPIIVRLQMSYTKKVGVAFIFALGFFICLTTALRMKTVVRAAYAKETTWESCPANLWSFIEVAIGVICASLISLRKMFAAMWPERFQTAKKSSDYQIYASGKNGPSRRSGPSPGSQRLKDVEEQIYPLDSKSTFTKNNGTTHDPSGNLLGACNITITAGPVRSESQEQIIRPDQAITVRREVSVRRQRH